MALVVGYHAFDLPMGGFVGVDVFFVISGYLITGVLLREHRRAGRISILDFYRRRARRILPAAILVLLVTTIASFVLFHLPRAFSVLLDAFASVTFVQNWHLIAVRTDYLGGGTASPLQHFWSLAVEEQFYALWPIAVIVLLSPLLRSIARRERAVAIGAALLIVGSITLAVVSADASSGASYFNTATRAWELGVGAWLACIATRITRFPRFVHELLVLVGLIAIVASAVSTDGAGIFPWPGAVPAVLGAALVIAGGAGARTLAVPLRASPLRFLGSVSYPLYLWHFPAIVFIQAVLGPDLIPMLVACALSVLLAVVTTRFVEQPFRHPRRRRVDGVGTQAVVRARHRRLLDPIVAVTAVLVLATLTIAQLRGPAVLTSASALQQHAIDVLDAPEPRDRAAFTTTELHQAITGALASAAWPMDLSPALDLAVDDALPPAMSPTTGCRNSVSRELSEPRICSWGAEDAEREAVVIGDSIALSWTSAIVGALVDEGWRVRALGYSACPPITSTLANEAGSPWFPRSCAEAQRTMHEFVEQVRPDLTILSSTEAIWPLIDTGASDAGADPSTHWRRGTAQTLAALAPHTGRTVVLSSAPTVESPRDCSTRLPGPQACVGALSGWYGAKWEAERAAVEDVLAGGVDAKLIDTRRWLCDEDGRCPAYIDDTLVRVDALHLTERMSASLAGVMREELLDPDGRCQPSVSLSVDLAECWHESHYLRR